MADDITVDDTGYGSDGDVNLQIAPDLTQDALLPDDTADGLDLASLPPRTIITVHGLTMASLRHLLLNAYGQTPESLSGVKNLAGWRKKCEEIITTVGHVMICDKSASAISFGKAQINTELKHFANWQPKTDMSRPPEKFVGVLGPKAGRLKRHLPIDCLRYFLTEEMLQLVADESSKYPNHLFNLENPPPWVPKNKKDSWPYKWVRKFVKDKKSFKVHDVERAVALLYLLAASGNAGRDVGKMFGTCRFRSVPWLKEEIKRDEFRQFLAALHCEDSGDPVRPNGVPKVGQLMELLRVRCNSFVPEECLSYDEATAKYGGRMSGLKHLQSKYKPYDGIRVYCLNGSKTTYLYNFKVDLRDGKSIEDMAKEVFQILTPDDILVLEE
eukprot:SAG31_NODE_2308_length_5966_cov_3.586330_1_plen_384_part_10